MVPLDGSKAAETSLRWAARLGLLFGAEIVLFHAIEKNPPYQIHGETHLKSEKEASAYLARIAATLRADFGFASKVSTHVHIEETADVAASIAIHMKELGPDLVVMCSHGRSSFTRAFIGSLATRVIGLGDVPVFLVKPSRTRSEQEASIARVIVPLDNASIHDSAIRYGEEFARTAGAKLALLSVVPKFGSLKGRDGGWGLMSPATSTALLNIEETSMREHLEEHSKSYAARGVEVETSVVRGDPARSIAKEATRWIPALIVLGTHGRSGTEAFWKGSVAAKVVSLSESPILLVSLRE